MTCLNISQNVTRKTFKITRKYPPNNPQPHQENGASDATERLKIDNQVAGVNTVTLTYGNRSASVRIFSVVISTMQHTKRGSVYHLPLVVVSTMQPSHRHAKGIYHYQLYPSNPPMVEKPTAGRPASPNGGLWKNQRVRP
ncbi:Uncharacterised protein [Escherichia coli]|uniref:hypothetical protein n=1 Tax=Escherichia coli TaxID=562 RepID=UPI000DA4A7CE|nr:hypothetical protein [Escherichia coli]SQY43623.1 Uncharacterised protein [Escherichia coli]SQZ13877.1 Uncharacterised protein [Escherichia coli]